MADKKIIIAEDAKLITIRHIYDAHSDWLKQRG